MREVGSAKDKVAKNGVDGGRRYAGKDPASNAKEEGRGEKRREERRGERRGEEMRGEEREGLRKVNK